MQNFQDIEHFVKTLSAAIKKKIPTKVSQLTNDAGYKTTDTNTTYKLSKSGSTVTLTGSDGSTTSVADSNTTYSSLKNPYSLTIQNNGTTVTSYDGSTAKTANFTNATTSANGLMSASDKSKLDSVDSTYATKSELSNQISSVEGRLNSLSADLAKQEDNVQSNASAISTLSSDLAQCFFINNASTFGKIYHYGANCDRESNTTITIDFGSDAWDNMTALIFTRYALVGFQVTVYQTGAVTNHPISNIVGEAPFSATHSDSKVTLTVNAWETFEMLFTLHGNVLPTFTVS